MFSGALYNWAAVLIPMYKLTNRFIDQNMSNSREESGAVPAFSLLEKDLVRLSLRSSCCISSVSILFVASSSVDHL